MYLKARRRSTTIGELVSLPGPKFVSFFALKSTFRTRLGAGPSGLEPEFAAESWFGHEARLVHTGADLAHGQPDHA